ncbi:hypothetical protein [Bradyrhizobium sp. CB82]
MLDFDALNDALENDQLFAAAIKLARRRPSINVSF